MDKRYLHHLWTRIRPVKTWWFLAGLVLCAAICGLALRHNYATMVKLRTQVYTADANNVDVVGALDRLRAYVNTHMNTNLETGDGVYPPIQLTHTYDRLKKAESDRVSAATQQVYTDAQHYCEGLYPANQSISGRLRVPCIEQYVKDHVVVAKTIPDALYKFSFATPRWSPDAAGIFLVLSIVFLALTVLRFIAGRLLERVTR